MQCQNNFSPIVPAKLSCIFVSESIQTEKKMNKQPSTTFPVTGSFEMRPTDRHKNHFCHSYLKFLSIQHQIKRR